MRRKLKANLVYNTLILDNGKLSKFNIFRSDFMSKLKKQKFTKKSQLKDFILLYCRDYWSRTEYEIIVSDMFCDKDYKIDVFYQVELNIDLITDYVNREVKLELS